MADFLGSYGFFILIGLLMLICHLGHGTHGRRDKDRGKDGDGHQH
jgi:hypothetical protein